MPIKSCSPISRIDPCPVTGKKLKGKMLVSSELSKMVAAVRDLFPHKDVAKVVQHLEERGREVNISNLIDAIYEFDQQSPKVLLHTDNGCLDSEGSSSSACNSLEYATEPKSEEEVYSSESEDEDVLTGNDLKQTKENLRQKIQSLRVICQYCHERRATILLLPCAHLACCENCLMDVRRCPVARCKKIIRGTKEVFFC